MEMNGRNVIIEDGQIRLPKFADLLYDEWFKIAFGTEKWKRLLLLLLRRVIPERDIQDITYQPTEYINPLAEKADIRIDVECVAGDGTRFIVELQRANQRFFGNRMLYYSTFGVQQQLRKGHADFNYPTAYVIAIMNFDFHGDERTEELCGIGKDEYMFRYMLCEAGHPKDILTDRLQIILLELPRVTKEQAEKGSGLQKFCYYLGHLTEIDDIPEKDEDELLGLLHNSAKTDTFTTEERNRYIETMTTEQDIKNQIEYSEYKGMQKGIEIGLEKGREDGLEKGRLEMTKKMIEAGLPLEQVMTISGMSEEEIKSIPE